MFSSPYSTPTYGPGTANVPMYPTEYNEFLAPKPNKGELKGPSRRTHDPYVTGTSVLGLKYKDGVMLAADTLASYGTLARFRSVERIKHVGKDTLLGASGEISDFQYIQQLLEELVERDRAFSDGSRLSPAEIHSYLVRVLYGRRNKFDPLWNQLLVAGHRNGKSFLGFADSVGTSFEDDTMATGFGAYIARPLLRNAYRPDLTEKEARAVLESCMRVLFYRDARTINKIQIASVSAEGVNISEPFELETEWYSSEAALGYPTKPSGEKEKEK